jgi:hypothetical protein
VATPAPGQPPTTTASWPTPHRHSPGTRQPGSPVPDFTTAVTSTTRSAQAHTRTHRPRRPQRHQLRDHIRRPAGSSALTATPPRRAAVSACASWAAARDPSLTHHRRNPAPPRLPHCGRSPRRGGRVRGARRALRSGCGATVLCGAWGPRSAPPLTRPARKDDDRPWEPDSLTARKLLAVNYRLYQQQQLQEPDHGPRQPHHTTRVRTTNSSTRRR